MFNKRILNQLMVEMKYVQDQYHLYIDYFYKLYQ